MLFRPDGNHRIQAGGSERGNNTGEYAYKQTDGYCQTNNIKWYENPKRNKKR